MVYLWVVSFLWAFSFGIIKGALSGLDSFFIALVRLSLAALAFAPFLVRTLRVSKTLKLSTIAALAGVGALQFGVMYVAYFSAFRFLKAYEVALFTVFTPLYVTLIADALERRFQPRYLLAALIAVGGSFIASFNPEAALADFWAGFGLVQLSNLAFAAGQVGYRAVMRGGQSDAGAIGWLYLGGAGLVGLAALFFSPWGAPGTQPQPAQWLALLYLGVVASGLGFFLWNKGARLVNSGALAVFNNLKAPLAVAVSLLVFGEQASLPPLLLGGALLLLALWLAREKKQP